QIVTLWGRSSHIYQEQIVSSWVGMTQLGIIPYDPSDELLHFYLVI
ncbi:13609_t:CDS:2, partial [Racocetra fulgida]